MPRRRANRHYALTIQLRMSQVTYDTARYSTGTRCANFHTCERNAATAAAAAAAADAIATAAPVHDVRQKK